jgi:hypothetical protein
MKNFFLNSIIFSSLGGIATLANAGLVLDLTKAVNGFVGVSNGYYGARLYTDDIEALTALTFEFAGSEASYDNKFIVRGSNSVEEDPSEHTILNHFNGETGVVPANDSNRQSATLSFAPNSWLDFSFVVDDGDGFDTVLDNVDNKLPTRLDPVNGSEINFFIAYEYDAEGAIESLLLGLDDGGGVSTTDEDYNDIIIRISGFDTLQIVETPVPVPGSLPLFISALGTGLILIKRRPQSSNL